MQRWGTFMAGSISYDEFQAVVTATLTESWKWASVQEVCRGGEACYLYSNALGI